MINLIRDYWNSKSSVHVLKISEKSVRKLIEYSGVVDLSLNHSFFCRRMLLFCSKQAQQKPPQYVVYCLFGWSSEKKPSVLA